MEELRKRPLKKLDAYKRRQSLPIVLLLRKGLVRRFTLGGVVCVAEKKHWYPMLKCGNPQLLPQRRSVHKMKNFHRTDMLWWNFETRK